MSKPQFPKEFEALRVLVVDDEEEIRDLVQQILRDMGIVRVHLAENGEMAWQRLSRTELDYDLVISDWLMPRMDGFEVASLIRHDERLKDIPIIVFSGMELDAEQSETVNQYTAGIINKTDLDHEDRLTELLGSLITVKPAS